MHIAPTGEIHHHGGTRCPGEKRNQGPHSCQSQFVCAQGDVIRHGRDNYCHVGSVLLDRQEAAGIGGPGDKSKNDAKLPVRVFTAGFPRKSS